MIYDALKCEPILYNNENNLNQLYNDQTREFQLQINDDYKVSHIQSLYVYNTDTHNEYNQIYFEQIFTDQNNNNEFNELNIGNECPFPCKTCIYEKSKKQIKCLSCAYSYLDLRQIENNCECPEGYYDQNKACHKCSIDNCVKCNNDGSCQECNQEYFLNIQNKCQQCTIEGCIKCQSQQWCEECDQNYIRNSEGNCQTIDLYLLENERNQNCIQLKKNDSAICEKCKKGFYLDLIENQCYSCSDKIDNCQQCLQNPPYFKCQQCYNGYFLAQNLNQCQPCDVENCKTCENNICTQCIDNYFMNKYLMCVECMADNCKYCEHNEINICKICKKNYQLEINTGQCFNCSEEIEYCAECHPSEKICLRCKSDNYTLKNGVCYPKDCFFNCLVCKNNGFNQCHKCDFENHLVITNNDGTGFCVSNNKYQFYNQNDTFDGQLVLNHQQSEETSVVNSEYDFYKYSLLLFSSIFLSLIISVEKNFGTIYYLQKIFELILTLDILNFILLPLGYQNTQLLELFQKFNPIIFKSILGYSSNVNISRILCIQQTQEIFNIGQIKQALDLQALYFCIWPYQSIIRYLDTLEQQTIVIINTIYPFNYSINTVMINGYQTY
ncbi:Insulin-like growth factor binding protein, N-terminal [Pseudocohnilembus persalinus]|uniref:Insulin-like growth factor binding protein, N-terminal n=1 Tax=Pseudocohnilembus persalinus TaxID=266149 RepID=A0A0V0R3I0_PSEPJ|nr:Insulin-like growth factor binding protein, N-terminal [Pseudocohnilembus persalinus]|eukprot:KRX09031.1 Insulin-like growth factor binding protein, N-terminal [Pseudocohnilembus persalinus]